MKKILMILLIVAPLAVADEQMPSDQEIEQTVAQAMEVARRVSANGMSYQVLKRCGANPDILKKTKLYLYQDIAKVQSQNPAAKVDIDGLFELAATTGDEYYEMGKDNPKFCSGMLEEANTYISK